MNAGAAGAAAGAAGTELGASATTCCNGRVCVVRAGSRTHMVGRSITRCGSKLSGPCNLWQTACKPRQTLTELSHRMCRVRPLLEGETSWCFSAL